ncbi:flagella synthesis protein FlgN [Nissabacter sp. SGAir0207]|uniref:flagella synthesis protein FlgN n=1 Tax=Nissabacter sp. SGAir0207 TaxID=2126321 RepID=UPI00351A3579
MHMHDLPQTLTALLDTLRALLPVMEEEQAMLCAAQVNGVALQRLTEQKSSLLATLAYLDGQRKQHETTLSLRAPYAQTPALNALWRRIAAGANALNQRNHHNGRLLNQHIAHNQQSLSVLRAGHGQTLYGPNGQAHSQGISMRKISI